MASNPTVLNQEVTTPSRDHNGGGAIAPGACEDAALRKELRFHFMNPIDKWRFRRDCPWKLLLQILKLATVTLQLILFGELRLGHITYLDATKTALKHLYIKNWDAARDLNVYPPLVAPYAVFTENELYEHLDFALAEYVGKHSKTTGTFVAKESSPGVLQPVSLCMLSAPAALIKPNAGEYVFDIDFVTDCVSIEFSHSSNWTADSVRPEEITGGFVRQYLHLKNFTIDFVKLQRLKLELSLRNVIIIHPFEIPQCVELHVTMEFDNEAHNGITGLAFNVGLDLPAEDIECNGTIDGSSDRTIKAAFTALLDVVILLACAASFLLCVRALYRAEELKKKTATYFQTKLNKKLSKSDELVFLDLWYVTILVNDVCTTIGTLFKLNIEFRGFDSSLFIATGFLLGFGTMLVWLGVLRYLQFFSRYNILLLTLKKAFPNVMRFMACAGIIYFSFMLCGWIVLGPHHFKFRTLMSTSEALFAMLNGDDMFATFFTMSLPDNQPSVIWFGRIYLYTFISLFMYVILSIFISIIMDAYEIIRERYTVETDEIGLKQFLSFDYASDEDLLRAANAGNATSAGGAPGTPIKYAGLRNCFNIPGILMTRTRKANRVAQYDEID